MKLEEGIEGLVHITELGGEYFRFDAADPEASAFGLNWHEPKRVCILIAPDAADYVRDRVWSEDQTIEDQDDGSLILWVTTTSEKELNAWVWSFGGMARVMEHSPDRPSQVPLALAAQP